jgi:hypothetical protein
VTEILASYSSWVDREGKEREISLEDILVIAPYNAQVFELQERLPGARIGTVDKFQGSGPEWWCSSALGKPLASAPPIAL